VKAAVLHALGSPLRLEDVPDPVGGAGEVLVDVLAAPVVNYTNEVISGKRPMLFQLPFVPGPGAVGRVRVVPADATRLKVGDIVYCDPTVRARDNVDDPDTILQGVTARGPGGLQLQRHFKDGSFAEQMRLPTENATNLGDITETVYARWCAIGALLVPFGGLLAAGVQAGQTIVVNGATGSFGSAAIAVAFGIGATRVIATGRNTTTLAEHTQRFDHRLETVAMTGDEGVDTAAIVQAGRGAIDVVLDLLPPSASAAQVRAAIMAVRPNGRVVLMGGVTEQLDIPYGWVMRNNITIHGQWMYPQTAPARMIALIHADQIRLDHFAITEFDLEAVNEAIDHAAAHAGPFTTTVLRPNR
jgi:alcohol dehydrogenase